MVIRGFWPSYFGPLLSGGLTRPWIIYVHGAVFAGWMLLLLAQVSLIATGRVRLHRRVGTAGITYGALVLGIGLVVSVAAPVLHVRAGEWTVDWGGGISHPATRRFLHGVGGMAADRPGDSGSVPVTPPHRS